MMELETFVLMENRNTGSAHLSAFFDKFSKEPMLRRRRHAPALADYDRAKLYVSSVRHPVGLYVSLFNYGLDGGGHLLNVLERSGRASRLYKPTPEGFHRWAGLLLKPKNAEFLGDGYRGDVAGLLGFFSFRLLRQAIAAPHAKLRACRTRQDVVALLYVREGILGAVLRNETLGADLIRLVRGPLAHAMTDLDAAVRHVEAERRENVSLRRVRSADVEPEMAARIMDREWLLRDLFYPVPTALKAAEHVAPAANGPAALGRVGLAA